MVDLRDLEFYTPGFVAFDAAVRLGSFTAAADELGVTQPTISYRIRQLEQRLGIQLFSRRGRGTRLTFEGQLVLAQIRESMTSLLLAARSIRRARTHPHTMTLLVPPSFATHWLVPRLKALGTLSRGVNIRILTTERAIDDSDETVDLAILRGRRHSTDSQAWPLVAEEVTPVCAPDFLPGRTRAWTAESLLALDHIDLHEPYHSHLTWAEWAMRMGTGAPARAARYDFTDYAIALAAAIAGQGLVLGWRHLVADLLRDGRLVAPLARWLVTGETYWVVQKKHAIGLPHVTAIREWLLQQIHEPRNIQAPQPGLI